MKIEYVHYVKSIEAAQIVLAIWGFTEVNPQKRPNVYSKKWRKEEDRMAQIVTTRFGDQTGFAVEYGRESLPFAELMKPRPKSDDKDKTPAVSVRR